MWKKKRLDKRLKFKQKDNYFAVKHKTMERERRSDLWGWSLELLSEAVTARGGDW